jgi:hypothetical protein
MSGATPACAKTQSIARSTDYRLLVPLWRTEKLYHELKASHGTYESAHDWWRDRYKVADDDLGLRPKVRDIRFHRLRANAAALVEWLRICYLAGWLGNPDRRTREATRKFKTRAERIALRLAEMRYRMGVMGGYGENAHASTSASALHPPSVRAARRLVRRRWTSRTSEPGGRPHRRPSCTTTAARGPPLGGRRRFGERPGFNRRTSLRLAASGRGRQCNPTAMTPIWKRKRLTVADGPWRTRTSNLEIKSCCFAGLLR